MPFIAQGSPETLEDLFLVVRDQDRAAGGRHA
jgi:hypothetical protein